MELPSTKPYLLRAIWEWCNDNGLTPHIAVQVNGQTQVPREFVQNGQIVLNVGMAATNKLHMGNEFIEFQARFAGVARELLIPVGQVTAIYARENGAGMAFDLEETLPVEAQVQPARPVLAEVKSVPEVSPEEDPPPSTPRPPAGSRPQLQRIK